MIKNENIIASHGVGDSLILLICGNITEKVLFVGNLRNYNIFFKRFFEIQKLSNFSEISDFSLILLSLKSVESFLSLRFSMKILKYFLKTGNSVILFADNCIVYEKNTFIHILKKIISITIHITRIIYIKYFLANNRIFNTQEFFSYQNIEKADEFIRDNSCGILKKKFFNIAFKGEIFVLSSSKIENSELAKSIANFIQKSTNQRRINVNISKFSIRNRGALVLFIEDTISKKKFIARVVKNENEILIIRKNEKILHKLLYGNRIDDFLKKKLPRPIGNCEFKKTSIFIETAIDGTLAWKISDKKLKKNIHRKIEYFLFNFNILSRLLRVITDNIIDKIFYDDILIISNCKSADPEFIKQLIIIIERLKKFFVGKKMYLVASHGDYGYGNILVDTEICEVNGVIDWDTGREYDIPGIDYINLKIQTYRIENKLGIYLSAKNVAIEIIKTKSIDSYRFFEAEFGIKDELTRAVLICAMVRYITRSAQYELIFENEKQEFNYILELISMIEI